MIGDLLPYLITRTDYYGVDYPVTVYLTEKEAARTIKNGREVVVNRRKELWDLYNAIPKWPYSGGYSRGWAERESIKQQVNDER